MGKRGCWGVLLFWGGLFAATSACRGKPSGGAPGGAGSGAPAVGSAAPSAGTAASCNDPDPSSCLARAKDFRFGSGGRKLDKEAAIQLYAAACARKVADACGALGQLHFIGEGSLKEDQRKSAALFEQACSDGSAYGCGSLGNLLNFGATDVVADTAKAQAAFRKSIELYEAGCQATKLDMCAIAASITESGVTEKGFAANPTASKAAYAQMLQVSKQLCDKKEGEACNFLGYLYDNGKAGLTIDKAKAARLFEDACAASDAAGCTNLGRAHESGKVFKKDLATAVSNFRRACELGDGEGCYNVARLLDEAGPLQDSAQALIALRDGCARESAGACNDLGVTYGKGEHGVPKDLELAVFNYRRGCNLGSRVACKNLKFMSTRVEADKAAREFRKTVSVGSDSHCGLVIEVKPPIAKIQTMIGEVWLKVEQLFPKGKENCRFVNGVYQDPD